MKQLYIDVDQLDLDPENPRLPENLPHDSETILRHIFLNGSLEELANSFLDNGFFEAERLIVIDDHRRRGRYTVVEGNRRLAALKILHGELGSMSLTSTQPSLSQLDALRSIPCLLVDSRLEVDRYLAYRHIGGMKTWSAEARARFTKGMVLRQVESGDADPFKSVGRQIGSNAQGVRNSFLAISVLEFARDELEIDTHYLQYDRFGVWLRCMNSGDIRSFIGIGSAVTFAEVEASVRSLNRDHLQEVISDLSTRSDERRPLVADSRDITDYGRVLADESARATLRRHEDFEIARQVVQRKGFAARIESIAGSVTAVIDELSKATDETVAADLVAPVEKLSGLVRSLRAIVRDLVEGDG